MQTPLLQPDAPQIDRTFQRPKNGRIPETGQDFRMRVVPRKPFLRGNPAELPRNAILIVVDQDIRTLARNEMKPVPDLPEPLGCGLNLSDSSRLQVALARQRRKQGGVFDSEEQFVNPAAPM